MPFMLGEFSSGLFGGASSMFALAQRYNEIKDKLRMNKGADLVQSAMQNGSGANDAGTGGLYGTSSAPTTDTGRPSYDTFDDDPELSKLPKLAKKTAIALKEFTSSPSEGRGVYGRGQPAQSSVVPGAPSLPAGKGALGRLSDQPGPGETEGMQGAAPDTGLFGWLGKAGQALRDYSASHTNALPQQQHPPAYLPPQTPTPPMPVQPQQPAPGASPGALQGPMSGGVPYSAGPSLAMQQQPLGARIMAAINPATGSAT